MLLAAALLAAGCGDNSVQGAPLDAATDASADTMAVSPADGGVTDATSSVAADAATAACILPAAPAGGCSIQELAPASEGAMHTQLCAPLAPATNPPASGTHYGSWPVFRVYDKPVPWGFLLHAMEHGAVVIAYNCPDGCAEELAAAKALYACVRPKPECPRPPVIVTPDPGLDVRFAAAAWGHILKASCFDPAAFARFIDARANKGPENFPNDCGIVDLEATGWCPAS